MTIIAGFSSHEGVVICADTQETVAAISKRHVAKVKVKPELTFLHKILTGTDLMAAFCGAGHGPFIDLIVRRAWTAAITSTSLEEGADKIERAIKDTYGEYRHYYDEGKCPEVELLYGLKVDGKSSLFSACGPIVNPVEGYYAGGAGYYMADFLASRMYSEYLNLYQCVIIAAYVLLQAKEHVDGCGGNSHIAVLRNDGESGLVGQTRVNTVTTLLEAIDRHLAETLVHGANLWADKDEFKGRLDHLETILKAARDTATDELKQQDEWKALWHPPGDDDLKFDPLGFLITPSTSQKSVDQQ